MTQKNKKSIIKDKNYLIIQGFMVNQLNLKGNDLLIYAIIYGFSQTENQKFTGSLQYLADWTQSTKQGVIKSIKKLMERDLIIKEVYLVNKVKLCKYSLPVFNLVERGIKQSLTGGIKQSLPNNKDTYNIDNKKDKNFLFFKKIIKKYKEPQKLRDTTIEKLYPSLKNKFLKCLKAIGSKEDMNSNIENYLSFIITENFRAKCDFEVWINQPKKYLEDWQFKENECLARQKAYNDKNPKKLTEKEKLIRKYGGNS